jgi:hypothetical protein
MHWKKRQKQIQYLQAKHGNDRTLAREFPDLKVEQRTVPDEKPTLSFVRYLAR